MRNSLTQLILFLSISLVALVGCSSMQQLACGQGNWENVGRNDARKGLDSQAIGYAAVCNGGKGLPATDRRAYDRGYAAGKIQYCTEDNGKLIGLQGAPYRHNCPLQLERRFLQGYYSGREQFEFRDALVRSNQQAAEARERSFQTFRTGLVERENRSCASDSDCNSPSKCDRDRCENSGKSCFADSDCTLTGHCVVDRCRSLSNTR